LVGFLAIKASLMISLMNVWTKVGKEMHSFFNRKRGENNRKKENGMQTRNAVPNHGHFLDLNETTTTTERINKRNNDGK
jgi:hypothetical protein